MSWELFGMAAWMLLMVGIVVREAIMRKRWFKQRRMENAIAKGMTFAEYEQWLEDVST